MPFQGDGIRRHEAANHHHFKRSRWRRLWRQQIQDWLIAAVQNVARLCSGLGAGVAAKPAPSPKIRRAAAAFALLRVRFVLRAYGDFLPWSGTDGALAAAA